MKLVQLRERLYYLPHEERRDRPVLTYVRGDRYALAVDAGASPAHVTEFYQELENNNLPRPDFTVLTHSHWDHSYGLCAVQGMTLARKNTNARLRRMAKWSWEDDAMKARLKRGEEIEFCDRCIRLEYPDPRTIRVVPAMMEFTGRLTLELGGVQARLRSVSAPHAPDCVWVELPELDTLCEGDAAGEDYYLHQGVYVQKTLQSYIRLLEQCPCHWILSGHGEPQSKEEALEESKQELR